MENKYAFIITLFTMIFALPTLVFGQCDFEVDNTIIVDATCNQPNGSVEFTLSGGISPYTLDWSGGTIMNNVITGLVAGTYDVTITDGTPCSEVVQVVIFDIGSPTIDQIVVTDATCGQANGAIEVFVSGGTPAYSVSVGSLLFTGNSPFTITGLFIGTYTVDVTDSNGCTTIGTVTIMEESGPTIDNISTVDATCGQADGSFTITVSGGIAPYTYESNGNLQVDNPTFTGLDSGTHAVSVTDANGCQAFVTANIFDADGPQIDNITITDATCGNADGGFTIVASGGIPPYTYSVNGISQIDNPNFTDFASGTYLVIVEDSNGCITTASFTINEEDAPSINNISTTDASCGQTNGSIDVIVSGGVPPYTFVLDGMTTSTGIFTNLPAGFYTITVVDANGCESNAIAVINEDNLNLSIPFISNPCGQADGVISVSADGGTPPYTYDLDGTVQSDGNFENLPAGQYTLVITDDDGCTIESDITLSDGLALSCSGFSQTGYEINCVNPMVELEVGCSVNLNFTYLWSNGFNGVAQTVDVPGDYDVTVTDVDGCTKIIDFTVTENLDLQCGTIQGKVTIDDNNNCLFDAGEIPFAGYLVQAVGDQTFFGFTDANGEYVINALEGDYEVSVIGYDPILWTPCVDIENVTVVINDIAFADFSIEKLIDCPLLEVQIATPLIRRCFDGYYTVNYCNNGTVLAEDASILVTLPEFMTILDAPAYTDNGDNTYTFEIGDIDFGECGSFTIIINTSCDAILGQTLCATAEIFPQDPCQPINPIWSGASLEITADCDGNEVIYQITNVGTGDMTAPTEYIVIEDGVMFMAPPNPISPLQLDAGQSMPITFPADGTTYILQVNQVEGHPGNSNPTLAVEGCGIGLNGEFTTGFINQFPLDDVDPFVDIDCHEVIGSYDPNDKQAFPIGYGDEHYITDSTEIDYLIRFQNTGTDTAFTVVVEDVLSSDLDFTTLRPGVSSHPYHIDIFGSDTIHFVFDNILLPDSNINEPLSHGFVQFSIKPRAGLPLETVVENYADIFFDFNEAIRTNTVFHTVGEDFVIISSDHETFVPNLEIQAVPNPFSDETRLTLKGVETQGAVLHLYNLNGQKMATQIFNSSSILIERNGLSAGMYFYKIDLNGQLAGAGKLMVK